MGNWLWGGSSLMAAAQEDDEEDEKTEEEWDEFWRDEFAITGATDNWRRTKGFWQQAEKHAEETCKDSTDEAEKSRLVLDKMHVWGMDEAIKQAKENESKEVLKVMDAKLAEHKAKAGET